LTVDTQPMLEVDPHQMVTFDPRRRGPAREADVRRRPKTVEVHLSSVYRKLGISSRSQLAGALRQPARAS
jgi:hypothetical protein